MQTDLMAEGRWVHITAAELPPGMSVETESQTDGAALLDQLEDLGGEVEDLGEAEVDGEPVTHLRSTGSFSDMADHAASQSAPTAGDELGEELQDALGEVGDSFGDIVVDVYVDGEGRVRRLVQTFGPTTMTVDYADFGADLDVVAPNGAIDLDELDPEQLAADAEAAMQEQMEAMAGEAEEAFAPVQAVEDALAAEDEQAFLAAQAEACTDGRLATLLSDLCDATYEQAVAGQAEQQGAG